MISRGWLTAAREPRWRALAGAFVTVVLAQGLSNSFPVFLLPISAELGGLRSLSAAVFSAHNLVMGLVGTVVDALMRRVGERPVMLAGAVILGGGVALAATADSPLGLLLWFGVRRGSGRRAPGQRRPAGHPEPLVSHRAGRGERRGVLGDGARHLPVRAAQPRS